MKKRGLFICLFCLLLVLSTGCSLLTPSPKTFSSNGLTIELTSAFKESDMEGFLVSFESNTVLVMGIKEEFSLVKEYAEDLESYAELVVEVNGVDSEVVKEKGLTYFVYEATADGQDFTYIGVVYEGSDAYWLVNLVCQSSKYSNLKDTMLQYAASVKVE